MKYLRYTGSFLSRRGVAWRVDIMQEADEAFATVGALEFPADEPLLIEWQREDKEAVVCGSSATLKIISPGDRTYEDLYSIDVGRVRLDVYRSGRLYWSGVIDPEFYEEPYEQASGYEVSLTFSDFGVLDRLEYDLKGVRTLREIVQHAMGRAGILHGGIDASHVSTTFEDGTPVAGGGLSVRSDNFTDEEGETSTLYEVLEGILQPLGVRIVQREGKVHLYDLNGLYGSGEVRAIEWDGDSQTMGTDKVASKVKVTFSPYSGAELMSGEMEYFGKYDVDHVNLADPDYFDPKYGAYYSYFPDYDKDSVTDLIDFTIFLHDKAVGLSRIGHGCKYFHLLPVTGGVSESTGVAYAFRTGGHDSIASGSPKWKLHSGVPHAMTSGRGPILTTERRYLPKLADTDVRKYRLRVVEEILLDARYNPFSGSTERNDEGNSNALKTCSAFVFIPARITLYDADGNALYHYKNSDVARGARVGLLSYCRGEWVEGADDSLLDCWLEYYNPDDLKEDAGIMGWKANRHCMGRPDGKGGRIKAKMYDSFKKMADGEYLPYPPVAGYLEIQICEGVLGYDYGQAADDCPFGSTDSQWDRKNIYGKLRWCLYKAPRVEVVNYNLALDAAELDDVEYSGHLNKWAKEEIGIDTVCGTSSRVCPTARGLYYRSDNGEQVRKLTRAGRTDHPETLLIGTLYSQYAGRKTTLSGEAVIDGGLHCYTEDNQEGKLFMLMSDVQDVISDSTEAEYCELRPDEYDKTEEA